MARMIHIRKLLFREVYWEPWFLYSKLKYSNFLSFISISSYFCFLNYFLKNNLLLSLCSASSFWYPTITFKCIFKNLPAKLNFNKSLLVLTFYYNQYVNAEKSKVNQKHGVKNDRQKSFVRISIIIIQNLRTQIVIWFFRNQNRRIIYFKKCIRKKILERLYFK